MTVQMSDLMYNEMKQKAKAFDKAIAIAESSCFTEKDRIESILKLKEQIVERKR